MLLRAALLVLGVSLSLPAQMKLTVAQVVTFVRSAVKLKQPDKEVANYLKKITLSERLDASTIEDLQGQGAGPRTVDALNALRESSLTLPSPPKPVPPPPKPPPIPPPSPEEQKRIIDQVRDYALNYTKGLPDFLCTQVTRRYIDPSGGEFWRQMDVLTARVAYVDHKEDYKLVLVNNRMMGDDASIHSVGGATSAGEFGSMMYELFEPGTEAEFTWERWATLRGRRAHVFSYRVAQARSKWHVVYEKTDDIVPAYHGLIYVDRDNQTIMRITLVADLPPTFPVQQASTVLDYDLADISGNPYILPLRAVVRMRESRYMTKNEVEFRLYRKFSAEATITFDTPDPLPAEKTEEQPAK